MASTPAPLPADVIQPLLDEADAAVEWALTVYSEARDLSRAQGMGIFYEQRQIRVALAKAAAAVIHHDFGPRATLAEVEARVRRLVQAVTNILGWACRNCGQQPPPWPTKEDEAAMNAAVEAIKAGKKDVVVPALTEPAWNAATMLAETERLTLWREYAAARRTLERLRLLEPQEPRQGPVPPDRFKWGTAETRDLTNLQYKLLASLCRGEELRDPVLIAEVMAAVYGIDPQDKQVVEKHRRRLKQLRERTQKRLHVAKVRLWIGQARSRLVLKPINK